MRVSTRFLLYTTLAASVFLTACMPAEADRKALQQGYADYTARQFDAAESAADAYLKKNPTAPNIDEAYYLRGLARLSKNDKSAAADFQSAIAKSQRNDLKEKSYRALGDMAFDIPNWQEALNNYQASATFAPDKAPDARTSYRIGACLQCLGQWDKAHEYFQRVITLNNKPQLTQQAVARMNARNFALQFAAFQDPAKAAELIKQLKATGITASATSELREAQLLFLVRSGNYPTWEEATAARNRLLPKYPLINVVP